MVTQNRTNNGQTAVLGFPISDTLLLRGIKKWDEFKKTKFSSPEDRLKEYWKQIKHLILLVPISELPDMNSPNFMHYAVPIENWANRMVLEILRNKEEDCNDSNNP